MTSNNKQGVGVTIKFDERQVERARVELAGISNGLNKALSGAINKVLAKGKTEAVAGLMSVLEIKKKDLLYFPKDDPDAKKKERISIIRSSPGRLEGFIKILTRPIGLINFKFKEVRKKRKGRKYGTSYPGEGVTTQVFKGGAIMRFRHSFVAVGANNNRHIFIRRKGGGAVGTYEGRFPLDSRKGPSLLTVYKKHPQLHERVEKRITEELTKELDSQINRFLKRSK